MKHFTFICGIFIFIQLIFSIDCAEKARFDYYRVYDVTAENEVHINIFQQITDYPDGYRFLNSQPSQIGMKSQLIVPPHKFGEFSELVEKYELNASLINNNLQDSIDKEELRYKRRKSLDWSSFWRASEIHGWMDELARNQPNDISIFSVGTSYEGRDIKGLRINIGGGTTKPKIFFEGTIHANEWIGTATVTYIMNELLTSSDDGVRALLQHFDWWFLPILNIDGYEYTWNVDRTWRKTRGATQNPLCYGADGNRNWDVNWADYGGSVNRCTSSYYGDHVFSETEMKQFADFLTTQFSTLFGYISFHSSGQLLMTPFAYLRDNSTRLDLLNSIGEKAIEAIYPFRNTTYRLGKISDFFGLVAGSSVDYVAVNLNPTIVYCYELSYSHILPNDEIIKVGQEIFASVKTIFQETIDRGIA